MNFSVDSRDWWASSYRVVVRSTSSSQLAAGWIVDLDHARIGGDAEARQARVGRRLVALQHHRQLELDRGVLDGSDDLEVVLQRHRRRHEEVEQAAARFGTQRAAGDPGGGL